MFQETTILIEGFRYFKRDETGRNVGATLRVVSDDSHDFKSRIPSTKKARDQKRITSFLKL